MSFEFIRPKITASETPELASAFAELSVLRKQVAAAEAHIIKLASATPAYAFIKGITSGSVPAGVFEGDAVVYQISGYSIDQRNLIKTKSATYVPSIMESVGPATLNTLLTGKLLKDDEKRKLVAKVLPAGILEGTVATAPIETDVDDDRPF